MFEFALFLRYDLNSLSLKLSERVPKKMCVCFWRILLNSQQLEKKVQLRVKKIHFVFILTILSSIVMTLSLFYGTILFFTGHFYREKKNCSLPNHYSCVILSCQAFARHAEAKCKAMALFYHTATLTTNFPKETKHASAFKGLFLDAIILCSVLNAFCNNCHCELSFSIRADVGRTVPS